MILEVSRGIADARECDGSKSLAKAKMNRKAEPHLSYSNFFYCQSSVDFEALIKPPSSTSIMVVITADIYGNTTEFKFEDSRDESKHLPSDLLSRHF